MSNYNEKELIRTEAEIEKILAERNKLQAELDRLTKKETQEEHKLATMKNRYKEEKTPQSQSPPYRAWRNSGEPYSQRRELHQRAD